MIKSNMHTHTTFSDGHNTPEEMILSALEKGFETLGFSDHSYTPFDESYCMKKESYDAYRAEINALKKKYADKLEILCGTEFDINSPALYSENFDYYIASVHYIYAGGKYYAVDHNADMTRLAIEEGCGGSVNEYARRYYALAAKCAELSPLFVGHFDLPVKFGTIDETDPVYRKTALEALDAVLDADIPVEINTGAISRSVRTVPYPSDFLLARVAERGGAVVIGSDCHSKDAIDCAFPQALELAVKNGVKNVLEFRGGCLREVR